VADVHHEPLDYTGATLTVVFPCCVVTLLFLLLLSLLGMLKTFSLQNRLPFCEHQFFTGYQINIDTK